MYLNCKSYFSYKYGTFSTTQLVEAAYELGVTTLALTNINATTDIWTFVELCTKYKIKPVAGSEIRNGDDFCYILLAKNNEGLFQINRFLSTYLITGGNFPDTPEFDNNVFIVYPFARLKSDIELKPTEFIGIQITEINNLFRMDLSGFGDKMVIRHPVTFQNGNYYEVHKVLRSIAKNTLITKLETAHVAAAHETFLAPGEIIQQFSRYQQLITNTFKLLDSCSVDIEFHSDKNQKVATRNVSTDRDLLRKLALEGLIERYGRNNKIAADRVEKELKVIDDLNFNAYFLINYDFINYAKKNGFFHVGRGSGANSIVAYCLKITDVDPISLDLYFERFLNHQRATPPDFDIDFSHLDRDKIFDYAFTKYGSEYVALLGSYNTFQWDSIIRELGKVYGLPSAEMVKLQSSTQEGVTDKIHKNIIEYGKIITGFPNYLSVHACGMLISEKPIHYYTALQFAPKGFPVTQFDMNVAEKIGLYKFDILSQRGLSYMKEALDLIKRDKGIDVDIHAIQKFVNDPKIIENLRTGNTIGCFYIESPSMRQVLRKLRCSDFITLVAASSIIRPGVSESGMMRQFIERYHAPDKFEYAHPKLEELLKETFGIMVYQEDVIKVVHYYAGLDLAKADMLRRAMSGKSRGEQGMMVLEKDFFEGAAKLERPFHVTLELWRQISSFAGYSFSKAHSASFAVESYQTLYLKTYFPVEFMVAIINNLGGFYSTFFYFQQLVKSGATVLNPCINNSEYLTDISGDVVYIGFQHVKNIEEKLVNDFITERERNGPYLNLNDFIARNAFPLAELEILVQVGAFRFTGRSKSELLWEAGILHKNNSKQPAGNVSLFEEPPVEFVLPNLPQTKTGDIINDIEFLGFTVKNIFDLLEEGVDVYARATEVEHHFNREITCIGYLICKKEIYTKSGRKMYFGTWIDGAGDLIDTVHFTDSALRYPLGNPGFYKFTGTVIHDFGVYNINVTHMASVDFKSSFTVNWNNKKVYVQPANVKGSKVYLCLVDEVEYIFTKAKDANNNGFWAFLKNGDSDMAREIGELIDGHYNLGKQNVLF